MSCLILLQKKGETSVHNLLSKVSNPNTSTSKALNKLFPFKSGSTPKFDPRGECVSTSARSKKKKFIPKYSGIDVVMLKKFQTRIPKGDLRQELVDEGRIKKVMLSRHMSPSSIKQKILEEFKCDDFVLLHCHKGELTRAKDDEELTAQLAIARRGCLYLCQKLQVYIMMQLLLHAHDLSNIVTGKTISCSSPPF